MHKPLPVTAPTAEGDVNEKNRPLTTERVRDTKSLWDFIVTGVPTLSGFLLL